ncbi:hypothetical protein FRC03_003382 [Tulasnella sp. 419]|nr:hypothetical protein FRC03_003382 [Tulasnella sp. 419]
MSDQAAVKKTTVPPLRTFAPVPRVPDVLVSPPLSQSTNATNHDDPTVILLFGWMDAQLPHIYKYTESYHRVFPGATQIIVRSRPSLFWQSEKSQIAYFQPAMKLLKEHGVINPGNNDRLLVHTFSNGGCIKMITLAKAIRHHDPSALKDSSALKARAVILDSCPGDSNLIGGIRAFTAGIRNKIFQYLAKFIVGFVLVVVVAVFKIARLPDLFEVMREDLLDPRFLPHASHRAYMYSVRDHLVPADAVEAHLQASRDKGIAVRAEKYERTAHVNHMKENPEKYWGIVRDTWKNAKDVK